MLPTHVGYPCGLAHRALKAHRDSRCARTVGYEQSIDPAATGHASQESAGATTVCSGAAGWLDSPTVGTTVGGARRARGRPAPAPTRPHSARMCSLLWANDGWGPLTLTRGRVRRKPAHTDAVEPRSSPSARGASPLEGPEGARAPRRIGSTVTLRTLRAGAAELRGEQHARSRALFTQRLQRHRALHPPAQ
jgi:hypothetical protein